MSSSEEELNEVPPGVSYGERVDVPVGNGKAKGLVDTGYEGESNPRIKFLQSHSAPKKYAFFTDKEGLQEWNFKPDFENDRRLNDYNNSTTTGTHWFGDTQLTDFDPIYCREIIQLPQNDDKRYQFLTKSDNKDKEVNFFDGMKRPLGKFKDSTQETSTGFMNYIFENGRSDSEQKLFYDGDSLFGGRRKRRTKAKKSKKRRTNKRSKSRS
jgi:hypothetical protein